MAEPIPPSTSPNTSDQSAFSSRLPGGRVVLTRPAERQQQLAAALRQAGVAVLELPALVIDPILPIPRSSSSPAAQGATTESAGRVGDAGDVGVIQWQPQNFDVLVFVSRAAWQYYRRFYWAVTESNAPSMAEQPQATPHAVQIDDLARTMPRRPVIYACVGLPTAKSIAADSGVPLSEIAYPAEGLSSDSEGLWTVLKPRLAPGASVLIVRGQTGRDWLADKLKDNGMRVKCLPVYRRSSAPWGSKQINLLKSWARLNTGTWLITSAESLAAIASQYDAHGFTGKAGFQPQAVVVVHERLVGPVRDWLSHWQRPAFKTSPDRTSHGPVAEPAPVSIPIVVTAPSDDSARQALIAQAREGYQQI